MFDPDAHLPRINLGMMYLDACLIAGIAWRDKQMNVRVVPTSAARDESVALANEIYTRVFRQVPRTIRDKHEGRKLLSGSRDKVFHQNLVPHRFGNPLSLANVDSAWTCGTWFTDRNACWPDEE